VSVGDLAANEFLDDRSFEGMGSRAFSKFFCVDVEILKYENCSSGM
jgi:hypothetical protein